MNTSSMAVSYTHLDVYKRQVIKVDDFERLITMQDGTKIPMDDILSIDGELFLSLE